MTDELPGCADDQIWRDVPVEALRAALQTAPTMTPETREELARAICAARQLSNPLQQVGVAEVDAIAPIIERLVAERVAAETERCKREAAIQALRDAAAQCRCVQRETTFSDSVSEDHRKGFGQAASACAVFVEHLMHPHIAAQYEDEAAIRSATQ